MALPFFPPPDPAAVFAQSVVHVPLRLGEAVKVARCPLGIFPPLLQHSFSPPRLPGSPLRSIVRLRLRRSMLACPEVAEWVGRWLLLGSACQRFSFSAFKNPPSPASRI